MYPGESFTFQWSTVHQSLTPFVRIAFPGLVAEPCVITKPVCADHAPALAEAIGAALATYAKDFAYDGVDCDWEEAINGWFGANAGGEQWLATLTTTLRAQLDEAMARAGIGRDQPDIEITDIHGPRCQSNLASAARR